jgi:hypothetical protein
MHKEEPDVHAEALAAALPELKHPSGRNIWLQGLAADRMANTRTMVAEALMAWLRKRNEDLHTCLLCGVAEGEVDAAHRRAGEAWEYAKAIEADAKQRQDVTA